MDLQHRRATVLIGAHTIGHLRHTFGEFFNGPSSETGGDDATEHGPTFDNTFFNLFSERIEEDTVAGFANNVNPYQLVFPDWFRAEPENGSGNPAVNYLDTDVVLAFPSQDESVHPSYHTFSRLYAKNLNKFIADFFVALDKMSQLGVSATLSLPLPCPPGSCGRDLPFDIDFAGFLHELGNADAEAQFVIDEKQTL